MYFDATDNHISKINRSSTEKIQEYEFMKKPNRLCKGTCLQFKALKPVKGGRYEAGQYRCQICEIYMNEYGVEGRFCKCCNMRVRSKPRNRSYKEKYHEKVRNAKDPWINTNENKNVESTKENTPHKVEKKSTPVYEEIDETVKTYYEFKNFLKTIKLETNYQLVILKELLEYGELHKGEISESLAYFNNKNTTDLETVKDYFDIPVYDVLLKHEFVIEDEGVLDIPYYSLNVQLEEFQKIQLIDYLSNEIKKYNQEHGIPENVFPNADNMGNINWSHSNIKSRSKVQKLKNFVNKIRPDSENFWIWSVTSDNWEIVKSKNVWGSLVSKEKISKMVKSGDQVAFYVVGSNSFKGIYEFVGYWHDSPVVTWDDDLEPTGELRYKSQIGIKPICLGNASLSELHEKMELFKDKPPHIRNLILQGRKGYPSNNQKSLIAKDFEVISDELKNNPTENTSIPNIEEKADEHSQSTKKETNSQKESDVKKESQNISYAKIFDSKGGVLNIKNCKIESTDVIEKDQILTNDDVISKFKVGNMGGIRYPKETNVIVLLSAYSDDYDDSIDTESGLIIYAGEGEGNQELKNGNEKILNSQNIPMVFFKEVYQDLGSRPRGTLDNKYKFVGTVKYQKHYWKEEKGRKVVKFVLEIQS